MTVHAPLPPSSAEQWGNCSGWLQATYNLPNFDTPETRAGTAAHWVMAEVLLNFRHPDRGPLVCSAYLGQQAPNGVVCDDKIVDGAQVMVNDVLDVCQRHGALQSMLIEHRVAMPDIHAMNYGTLDVAIFLPQINYLFLWDYKHGHRECAPDSLQLINYVKGVANHFGIDGYGEQQINVVLRIVQPFCYTARGPVREWLVRMAELRPFWNQLQYKAHEAYTDPKLTTGLHCRDCRAVGVCAATRQARYNFVELVNAPYAMDEMTGHDLAIEREILTNGIAVANARLDAIDDILKHRIRNGEANTGLSLESSPGRLNWNENCPPAMAKALFKQFDVDISKEAVLTPTQALEKADKKVRPMIEEVLKQFASRPAGALKLIASTETVAARAFQRR